MNTGIDHISHLIKSNTAGIIWLTDDFLGPQLVGMYELNYLLNALVTKSISVQLDSHQSKSNYFLGENFGNPFFVGHSVINSKDDLKNMYKHLELSLPLFQADTANEESQEDIEIFIYNRSKNTANFNVLKELSKKYSTITFHNLNI